MRWRCLKLCKNKLHTLLAPKTQTWGDSSLLGCYVVCLEKSWCLHLQALLGAAHDGTKSLLNDSHYLPVDMTEHPTTLQSSVTPLCELQISQDRGTAL
jgi:hypothetical protein